MGKKVRRRSNWYIYVITFIITSVLLSFAVWNMRDMIFPTSDTPVVSNTGRVDYRPDASFNANFLFMLSEEKGGVPEYYMMANYRPRDEIIVLVPVKEKLFCEVGNTRGSLSDIYEAGGADWVLLALKNSLGISCEHYIKFDKNSFMDFIDLIGKTPVNIPYTLKNDEIEFSSGYRELEGVELYSYLTFPDFEEGEDYRSVVFGSAMSGFINKNSQNLSVTQMQSFFNKVLNTTDTNLEFSIFTQNQSAYLYNTKNSFNMAEYYVPYGETDENGLFVVAEASKAAIKSRFGED